MKKLAVLILLGLSFFSNNGQPQMISSKSNLLKFQAGNPGRISSYSKQLKYNLGATGALRTQSGSLAFGSRGQAVVEVAKNEPEKIIAPVSVVTVQPDAVKADTQAERKIEVVEEKSPPLLQTPIVPVVLGKELGEEYTNNLPRYYALIIGVSNYKFSGSNFQSLENPAKDAKELYRVLTERYTFDTADVAYMKDPTKRQIIDELEMLSSKVGPKDNLLIFYAGHGYYDKQKELGYWLPSDATMSKSDWIINSTVKDYLGSIRSKHTLLITDACFGGSIFKTRSIDAYAFLQVSELYKDPSRKAITSGNLTEVPDKSLFLEQLLRKLNENADVFLPAQKLFTRIYEPITNNSTATPKFGVIQGTGDEGGDFIFIRRQK